MNSCISGNLCILKPVSPTPAPTPPVYATIYQSGKKCSKEGTNLGVHKDASSCASDAAALCNDGKGSLFQYSPTNGVFPTNWACMCCDGNDTDQWGPYNVYSIS